MAYTFKLSNTMKGDDAVKREIEKTRETGSNLSTERFLSRTLRINSINISQGGNK